jgi:aconitate hydratase
VLGGGANFALSYATKRYRSNLINWGMLPFIVKDESCLHNGCYIWVPNLGDCLGNHQLDNILAYVLDADTEKPQPITLSLGEMSDTELAVIDAGCLINYYKDN